MSSPSSSSSSFSPPPPPRPPTGSYPHGPASGSALDVIVVVPSSSSSSHGRGRRPDDGDVDVVASPRGGDGERGGGGVPSSSDFYVTFPPGLAWSPLSSRGPAATVSADTTGGTRRRASSALSSWASARFPDHRGSSSSSSSSRGDYEKGDAAVGAMTTTIVENRRSGGIDIDGAAVDDDDDDDVVVDWMTMSERGTSCTEPNVGTNTTDPTSMSTHPTTNGRANRIMTRRRRREGNVQVRINGRYVPQLDMIFSSAKQRASINGVGLPGSLNLFVGGNNDETSCRFVYGNGLRPPEEAFDALLRDGNEQRTACDDDDDDDCKDRVGGGGGAILCHGRNLLRYTLLNRSGVPVATAEAHLYLWRSCDSVVVSDVDGTVTKSDIRGVIDTLLQDKFQHVHDGICKFYHEVMDAGNQIKSDPNRGVVGGDGGVVDVGRGVDVSGEVRFLYLSSRPISFVNQTRKLLVSLSQTCPSRTQRNYGLPPGPIMCHTGPLSSVLYSELVAKNIYQFKADVLARQVVLPFVAARGEEEYMPSSTTRGSRTVLFDGPPRYNIVGDVNLTSKCIDGDEAGDIQIHRSSSGGISDVSSVCDDRLFLAGFGNKMTDAMAYEMAGIDRRDIFIIDKESRIICMDGTERKDDSSRSIISDVKGVISQSDCFLAGEECCPREIDRQLSSELLVSAHDNYASSSSDVNKVAVPIHSIELSLTQERRFESLDGLENFAAATTVDVYLTSVKVKEEGGKISTSKWARAKQTIRPFSSKRNSLLRFPSFGSRSSSGGASAPSSKKIIFRGYNDPLLFARIRERMVG